MSHFNLGYEHSVLSSFLAVTDDIYLIDCEAEPVQRKKVTKLYQTPYGNLIDVTEACIACEVRSPKALKAKASKPTNDIEIITDSKIVTSKAIALARINSKKFITCSLFSFLEGKYYGEHEADNWPAINEAV